MELADYGEPEYLDGATAQYCVRATDWSWEAYFTEEEDAKAFLALKSGTEVK
ncbi:hypothetical protein P67b_00044 [Ruegeria phage Tedan]|nr:hypothetical protein P67b_00044 [Ruegeria phage Tedan]